MKYEVTTDLIIHTKIKMVVEADSSEGAIDAAADILPVNFDMERAKGWRADVKLKPPRGVTISSVKAYHFEAASGSEKARKIG